MLKMASKVILSKIQRYGQEYLQNLNLTAIIRLAISIQSFTVRNYLRYVQANKLENKSCLVSYHHGCSFSHPLPD